MINWNYDLEAAKPEGKILVCVDNQQRYVGFSRWLPDEARWEMLATTQKPHAWSPLNHPLSDTPRTRPVAHTVTLPFGMAVSLPPGVK